MTSKEGFSIPLLQFTHTKDFCHISVKSVFLFLPLFPSLLLSAITIPFPFSSSLTVNSGICRVSLKIFYNPHFDTCLIFVEYFFLFMTNENSRFFYTPYFDFKKIDIRFSNLLQQFTHTTGVFQISALFAP